MKHQGPQAARGDQGRRQEGARARQPGRLELPPIAAYRLDRMRAIAAALENGGLRPRDIAVLLGCTQTSARRDLVELQRAGVVAIEPGSADEDAAAGQPRFFLASDTARIGTCLDGMAKLSSAPRFMLSRRSFLATRALVTAVGRRFHILADDDDDDDQPCSELQPARRDPLVAALFGQAGPPGGPAAPASLRSRAMSSASSA